MSKKGIFYIGFFVVLVGVFYVVIRPWIKPNTTISVVQPFAFINQDGQTVTNKDVEGKVYVAEYFFTTCTAICPKMNANMKKVYDRFKNREDFLILSHTSLPEMDSAPQLKRYAESLGVNTSRWIFLTGRKDSLYSMARNSYTIDDPLNNLKSNTDAFLHTQFWALVDKEGNVKKVYDGLKDSEVNALIRKLESMLD